MAEFSALESDVVDISDDVDAIENTLTQLKTDTFGNINLTGTNNTGSTITEGTFFYNNGSLVRAKTDIQNGSAITIGTNAETVTAGGLNDLKNSINQLAGSFKLISSGDIDSNRSFDLSSYSRRLFVLFITGGMYLVNVWANSAALYTITNTSVGTVSMSGKVLTITLSSGNTALYGLYKIY